MRLLDALSAEAGLLMTVDDSINTYYLKQGYASSDAIILSATKTTRTIFCPGIHAKGVRGYVLRQKIGSDGAWKDVNEVKFNHVPADCGVQIELDTNATALLYSRLSHLYEIQKQGVARGHQRYVVARQEKVLIIDDENKAKAIQDLLDQGHSEEFWQALLGKAPDLAARLAAAKIQFDREQAIKAYAQALTAHADDEAYWQKFFEDHPWMLQSAFSAAVFMLSGEAYLGGKKPIGRQGKGGVVTDFLFADGSTKSFAVVEIKTPAAKLVGPLYRGESNTGYDNEIYAPHTELSGSVVQTRNQITVAIENFQTVLQSTYAEKKLNRVHPKGVLLIGSIQALTQRQKDSFNYFRQGEYSLTIITFDELLHRLKLMYCQEPDTDDDAPWPVASLDIEDDEEPLVTDIFDLDSEPKDADDILFNTKPAMPLGVSFTTAANIRLIAQPFRVMNRWPWRCSPSA